MTAGLRWLFSRRPLISVLIYAGAANLVSAAVEVMAVIDLRAHGEPGGQIGAIMACAGVGVASFRSSWVGIFLGASCGLFITPIFHADLGPLGPVVFGLLGGFLGSFLGDGWRFARPAPEEHPPANDETPEETAEKSRAEK